MSIKIGAINPDPLRERIIISAFSKLLKNTELELVPIKFEYTGSDIMNYEESQKLMLEGIEKAKNEVQCDFYIHLRGRFIETHNGLEESAMVLVVDKNEISGFSNAVSFEVPEQVAKLVRAGIKFSVAVEQTYNISNVKEGNGFCGYLTKNHVTKADQYQHAVLIALSTILLKQNLS